METSESSGIHQGLPILKAGRTLEEADRAAFSSMDEGGPRRASSPPRRRF